MSDMTLKISQLDLTWERKLALKSPKASQSLSSRKMLLEKFLAAASDLTQDDFSALLNLTTLMNVWKCMKLFAFFSASASSAKALEAVTYVQVSQRHDRLLNSCCTKVHCWSKKVFVCVLKKLLWNPQNLFCLQVSALKKVRKSVFTGKVGHFEQKSIEFKISKSIYCREISKTPRFWKITAINWFRDWYLWTKKRTAENKTKKNPGVVAP